MANLTLAQLARGGTVKESQSKRVDVGQGLLDLQGQPTEMGTTGPTCGTGLDLGKITSGGDQFVNFVLVNGAAVPLNWGIGGAQNDPNVSAFYGVAPATLAAGNALVTDQIAGVAIAGAPKTQGMALRVRHFPIVIKSLQFVIPVAAAAQRAVPLNTISQNYNLDVCNQQGESIIDWTNANGFVQNRLIPCDEFSGFTYSLLAGSAISVNVIYSYKAVPYMTKSDGSC